MKYYQGGIINILLNLSLRVNHTQLENLKQSLKIFQKHNIKTFLKLLYKYCSITKQHLHILKISRRNGIT